MSTVRATVIETDGGKRVLGEVPRRLRMSPVDHFAGDDLRLAVGGDIEVVDCPFRGVVLVNEYGRLDGLALNPTATRQAARPGVLLFGPVVFVELVEQPEAAARG